MSNSTSKAGGMSGMMAFLSILISLLIGYLIWQFFLGSSANFDAEGHPKPGNLYGMMYKGGFIVPILIGILITVITFSIERAITIMKATGTGNSATLIRNIKSLIEGGQYDDAIAECDKNKGSLASVIRAGIERLKIVKNDSNLDKETKIAAVQKEIEEATALELPMLSKNMVIISTCATIATLWGLIGTVIGMIRSFAALSQAGAPDTTALATGISEALINTAFGIISSVVGIIMYNIFTSKIDGITHSMDEAGFSIVQSVSASK